jgi:hypothetical protein
MLLANLRSKWLLRNVSARCRDLCWRRRDPGLGLFHARGTSPVQTVRAGGEAGWVLASTGSDVGGCGRHSLGWGSATFVSVLVLEVVLRCRRR